MLQIYLYQYWTVAEAQKKGRSAPWPCTVYKLYMCPPNYYYSLRMLIINFSTKSTQSTLFSQSKWMKSNIQVHDCDYKQTLSMKIRQFHHLANLQQITKK